MRIALLDARQGERDATKSSTVAYRNMLILSKELGADLFVSAKQLAFAGDSYDAIICGFGSTSTEKNESVKFINRNTQAKIFWLVGEYEQSTFAPLFYSGRKFHVLKNYEHNMKNKKAHAQTFVNLNALLAGPAPAEDSVRSYGGIYYGRWRADRAIYFQRYLAGNVYLSTSPKNMKIFAANGCRPKYARAISWENGKETLRLFSASLYLEDVFTHQNYNCPANRYYEALKCGVPIVVQPESFHTWEKYNIEMDKWRVVRDASDFERLANQLLHDDAMRCRALETQKLWAIRAIDERSKVIGQIKQLIAESIN